MKLAVSALGLLDDHGNGHVLGVERDAVAEDQQQEHRQEKAIAMLLGSRRIW